MKTKILPKRNHVYLLKPWEILKNHKEVTDDCGDYREFIKSKAGQGVVCSNSNEAYDSFSEPLAVYIIFYDMIEKELIKEEHPEDWL